MEATVRGEVGDNAPRLVEEARVSRGVIGCATTQLQRMVARTVQISEKTAKQNHVLHQRRHVQWMAIGATGVHGAIAQSHAVEETR